MKNFLIIILFFVNYNINAQYTAIPDNCFEEMLIDSGIDSEGTFDGQVLTSDISVITNLFLNINPDATGCVSDLTGIQDFTSLISLNCDNNQIHNLEITNLPNLKHIFCENNEMENLIINNNPNLEVIYCPNNLLTSLYVGNNNPSLRLLNCNLNEIQGELNTSNNPELTEIQCAFNQIQNIDISNNIALTYLQVGLNQLTEIDLSGNSNIKKLFLSLNPITTLNISNLSNLELLQCIDNDISELDLSFNSLLNSLRIESNSITLLDLTQNPLLEFISVKDNLLSNLDVRNGNNDIITNFNTTNNPNLTCIFVDDATYSTTNWLDIDENSTFVETEIECNALNINDFTLNNISIYPNPTKDILFIENPNNKNIEFIKIYNLLGQQVLTKSDNFNQINLTQLKPAMYLVVIKTKKGIINTKIVKK